MSDLDNEELEATRLLKNIDKKEIDEMIKSTEKSIEEPCKFLKDNFFIEYKEKSADEMFEELGYKKIENKIQINYVKPYENIQFLLNVKKIEYHFLRGSTFLVQTMQELKAINKKCKELGWIE